MSKYIQIPPDIQVVSPQTKKPARVADPDNPGEVMDEPAVKFCQFVRAQILSNRDHFGQGYEPLKLAREIDEALENAEPGEWVQLDNAAHKRMALAVDSSKWPVAPLVAMQLIPFMDAIKDAKDKPLAAVEPEAAEG